MIKYAAVLWVVSAEATGRYLFWSLLQWKFFSPFFFVEQTRILSGRMAGLKMCHRDLVEVSDPVLRRVEKTLTLLVRWLEVQHLLQWVPFLYYKDKTNILYNSQVALPSQLTLRKFPPSLGTVAMSNKPCCSLSTHHVFTPKNSWQTMKQSLNFQIWS